MIDQDEYVLELMQPMEVEERIGEDSSLTLATCSHHNNNNAFRGGGDRGGGGRRRGHGHDNSSDYHSGNEDGEEDEDDDENHYKDLWKQFLKKSKNAAWIAPVGYFKDVPFQSQWAEVAKEGLVVEFPKMFDKENERWFYWVGTVVCFAGYKALIQEEVPEGIGPRFRWIPFFINQVKPFGHCKNNGIDLNPGFGLSPHEAGKFMVEVYDKLRSCKTISEDHAQRTIQEIQRLQKRFKMCEMLEVTSNENVIDVNLAQIIELLGGDRIKIQYLDGDPDEEGRDNVFYFSQRSHYVHKMGWCQNIGVQLVGGRANFQHPIPDPSEFKKIPDNVEVEFEKEMLFEMRHPCLPHKFVPGYVITKLKNGYFVAGTDWSNSDEHVGVIMHLTSDYIQPINFCRDHNVIFTPPSDIELPSDDKSKFDWSKYLQKTRSIELDLSWRDENLSKRPNPFTKGCKLEAVSVICPKDIRPATVTQVAGRLLRLHFDGASRKDQTSYQWVSCDSSNIYPAGYAQLVGHTTFGEPSSVIKFDTVEFVPVPVENNNMRKDEDTSSGASTGSSTEPQFAHQNI